MRLSARPSGFSQQGSLDGRRGVEYKRYAVAGRPRQRPQHSRSGRADACRLGSGAIDDAVARHRNGGETGCNGATRKRLAWRLGAGQHFRTSPSRDWRGLWSEMSARGCARAHATRVRKVFRRVGVLFSQPRLLEMRVGVASMRGGA